MSETFEQAAERLGHVLIRDEDGNIDYFVVDVGFHNGPGCVNCRASWCHHCSGPGDISPCIGKDAADAKAKEARRKQWLQLNDEFGK